MISPEKIAENVERMRRSSEFLRQSVTPPAPISNTVRQSMADALDEAVEHLSELLTLRAERDEALKALEAKS